MNHIRWSTDYFGVTNGTADGVVRGAKHIMSLQKTHSKRAFGFAAAAGLLVAGLAVATPQDAVAAYSDHHPLVCQVASGNPTLSTNGYFSVVNQAATLLCPIPDDTALPAEDIATIRAYTFDGTSTGGNFVRIRACARARNIAISACGTTQSAGGSGYKTLTLSGSSELNDLQLSGYQSYLHVYMESSSSNEEQRFMSYRVND